MIRLADKDNNVIAADMIEDLNKLKQLSIPNEPYKVLKTLYTALKEQRILH